MKEKRTAGKKAKISSREVANTRSALAKVSYLILRVLAALQSVPLDLRQSPSGRTSAPQLRALLSLARNAYPAQQHAVRGCRAS